MPKEQKDSSTQLSVISTLHAIEVYQGLENCELRTEDIRGMFIKTIAEVKDLSKKRKQKPKGCYLQKSDPRNKEKAQEVEWCVSHLQMDETKIVTNCIHEHRILFRQSQICSLILISMKYIILLDSGVIVTIFFNLRLGTNIN